MYIYYLVLVCSFNGMWLAVYSYGQLRWWLCFCIESNVLCYVLRWCQKPVVKDFNLRWRETDMIRSYKLLPGSLKSSKILLFVDLLNYPQMMMWHHNVCSHFRTLEYNWALWNPSIVLRLFWRPTNNKISWNLGAPLTCIC